MHLSKNYHSTSLKHVQLLSRMCFLIYPWCDEDLNCRLLPTFKFEPNHAGQQNDLIYHYECFKLCHRHEQTGGRCLKKAYNCPFNDCQCIQMQPCSEKLSQDDYCNQLAKLRGVTPLHLALDGCSYEGQWESERVQFSSYSPSKPAPTNGELARQHHQAHLRGMERMSSPARAHCQKIEDNLRELYSTRHLLQKHMSETDSVETSTILKYRARIDKCKRYLSITETEPLSPHSKCSRHSSGYSP